MNAHSCNTVIQTDTDHDLKLIPGLKISPSCLSSLDINREVIKRLSKVMFKTLQLKTDLLA